MYVSVRRSSAIVAFGPRVFVALRQPVLTGLLSESFAQRELAVPRCFCEPDHGRPSCEFLELRVAQCQQKGTRIVEKRWCKT